MTPPTIQADELEQEFFPLPLDTGRLGSAFSATVENAADPALSTKAVPGKHVQVPVAHLGMDAPRSSTCPDLYQTKTAKLTNTGKVRRRSDAKVKPLMTPSKRRVSSHPSNRRTSKLTVSMTDAIDAALRLPLPVSIQPSARNPYPLDNKRMPVENLTGITKATEAALRAPLDLDTIQKKKMLQCIHHAPRASVLLDLHETRPPSVASTEACQTPVQSRRTSVSSSAEMPATGLGPILAQASAFLEVQEVRPPSLASTKACQTPVQSRKTSVSSSAEMPATGLGPILVQASAFLEVQEVRPPSVASTKACQNPVRSRRTSVSSSAEMPATGWGPLLDLTDDHSSKASSAHNCCTPRSANRQLAGRERRFSTPQAQTAKQCRSLPPRGQKTRGSGIM